MNDISDKLLDKLQKMKRMVEGAKQIGSESEAQAFADKLQQMLLDHDLQMSDLEFERLEQTEPITDGYVDYRAHGVKTKKTRVAWMERLAAMIARNNFCRIIVQPGSSNFWLVGRAEHRAVAEYTIVTLTRALESIATKEYGRYFRECQRDGDVTRARGFREAFITGFLFRLFERLETRKQSAGESSSTALMRLNREDRAVDEELDRRRKLDKDDPAKTHKGTGLRIASPSNREGIRRGRTAAENVSLDGRAISNQPSPRRSIE